MGKKKLLVLLLPTLLLVGCKSGGDGPVTIPSDVDTFVNTNITYSMESNFMNMNFTTKKKSFVFSYSDLATKDNTKYDASLADLGLMLSCDAYDRCSSIMEGETAPSGLIDYQTIYKNLKCDNIKTVIMKGMEYEVDKDDLVNFVLANHKWEHGGKKMQAYFVTLEGTNGDAQWASNFDIGYDNETYTELTGTHAEWSDKNDAKGFNITANRVLSKVLKYVDDNKNNDAEQYFFVSGHSRGAAVANILGHLMNQKGGAFKDHSFVYTFAAPTSVANVTEITDKNIFNIINDSDVVSAIPLSAWGFGRYGTTIRFNPKNNAEFNAAWKESHNADYELADVSAIETAFTGIASTRESIYTYQTATYNGATSLEDAQSVINSLESYYPGISKYAMIEKYEDGVTTFKYVPFMVTCVVQGVINGANPMGALTLGLFNASYLSTLLSMSSLISGNAVAYGHQPTTYFVMMDYIKA